jgi:flagellin-like protein
MEKKAVSPVVSTVLLVMIVIILAVIILLWSRGFIKEVILKEIAGESKRVEQYCQEAGLNPIYNEYDGSFGFQNIGNVPIYAVNVKLVSQGSSNLIRINDPNQRNLANPSRSVIIQDPNSGTDIDATGYEEVKIIPILLGKLKDGGIKEFQCDEIHGIQII